MSIVFHRVEDYGRGRMEGSWLQAIKKYACARFGYSTSIRGIDGTIQQFDDIKVVPSSTRGRSEMERL